MLAGGLFTLSAGVGRTNLGHTRSAGVSQAERRTGQRRPRAEAAEGELGVVAHLLVRRLGLVLGDEPQAQRRRGAPAAPPRPTAPNSLQSWLLGQAINFENYAFTLKVDTLLSRQH